MSRNRFESPMKSMSKSVANSRLRIAFLLSLLLSLLVSFGRPAVAQRNLKDIPDSDPEIERKSFIVADGFEVNLFAGDPKIAKPIHMNFDERGRLWIAGSSVYPHIKPGQEASDRILILEDTDGDGQSDRTTVFAEGLLIPTGIAPAPGGCYVANSTELIHLIDTDGDDRADQKKVILSGFGTEDTHHLLHTLRWGHDGCLYMNQSIYIHSHVETPYGVRRLNGGGIWRFRPETMELEVLCEGFVNPWGHHFDRWGQNFATDGAYGEGINYVFPGAVYVTAPGKKRFVKGLNPGSPKHCGLEIIGGGHLPEEFQGNMITNDFRANRVCRFVVTENGTAAFSSRQETELIKTKHVAFRPIDVKLGPDGAIYIADWYNPIIQHGEVDFRDPRRDHVHGRIWRLTWKGRPTLKLPEIANASADQLCRLLTAKEEWVRLHAKRMMKQQDPRLMVLALGDWIKGLDRNSPDYNHWMLEALWAHQAIRVVNEDLLEFALTNPDHRMRAAGIRVATEWRSRLQRLDAGRIFTRMVTDEHPRVRLESVRALARYPAASSVTASLKALDYPMDPYLDFALWKTVRDLKDQWLPLLQQGRFDYGGNPAHLTFAIRAIDSPGIVKPLMDLARKPDTPVERKIELYAIAASQGDEQVLGEIAVTALDLAGKDPKSAARILKLSSDSSRARRVTPRFGDPEKQNARIVKLAAHSSPELAQAAITCLGAWKIRSGLETLQRLAEKKHSLAAIDSLALLGGPEAMKSLTRIGKSNADIQVRQRAINVLSLVAPARSADLAIEVMGKAPDGLNVSLLIDFLLKSRNGPKLLREALSGKSIDSDVAKQAIRAVQASPSPDPNLIAELRRSGSVDAARWTLNPELLNQLVEEVSKRGDPRRGEMIYRDPKMQCFKCHSIAGAGGIIGPEMNSIGASAQIDYLIESLIDPNRKIKENYHSRIVQTVDGLQYSGIPIRENDQETVLRTAEGKIVTIPAEDIEGKKNGRSLMPEGLLDPLTRQELIDLVAFLSRLGKVGEFAIGNQQFARNWETLTWSAEAHRALNRTSFDTAANPHPALQWKTEYALVNGSVPVKDLPVFQIHGNSPKSSFLQTVLLVEKSGKVVLRFADTRGLSVWIDGKPRKIEKRLELSLDKGPHRINLSVNREQQDFVRLELLAAESTPARFQ